MSTITGSAPIRFSWSSLGKVLTVALWSAGSAAAIVFANQLQLVDWSQVFENPAYVALAVPIVNTLAYLVKEFVSDTRKDAAV